MKKNIFFSIAMCYCSACLAQTVNYNPYPTSGYLGLGIGSGAQSKLHISSLERTSFRIYRDGNVSNYLSIWQGTGASVIDPINSGLLYLGYDQSTNVILSNGGGRVGILNDTPEASLHIGKSNLGYLRTVRMILEPPQHWGAGWEFSVRDDPSKSYLGIGYGAEQFVMDHNGNVGIGTSSPLEKLDVNGRILSRMTNAGGWDMAIGASDGNGLLVGKINGNTNNMNDVAHILYRNPNGGIYYGYNASGTYNTQINSQNNGHSFFNSGGNVGIGTTSPTFKFHLNAPDASVQQRFERTGSNTGITDVGTDGEGFKLFVGGYSSPTLKTLFGSNGKVGIGTFTPDATLTVNGDIHAKEVKVDLNITGPDYVFEKDYNLMSLEEIKAYIDKHKHLPEVPSAKEMETNGVNLSEMNMILLKKVEELTLYQIEATKQIEILKNKVEKLESKEN